MWRTRVIVLGLGLVLARTASAQFAVEDVYVGAQTFITGVNTARQVVQQGVQIANEVKMIQNQIEQLAYDAANLTKSPLQLVNNLTGLLGQYEMVLSRAGGLGFAVQGIEGRIGTVYPVFGQPVQGIEDGIRKVRGWMDEIRHASVTAMTTQAVRDRLIAQRALVQAALVESDNAPGQLAVIQDSNQILGILVEQQASMQQLTAASARLQATMSLGQAAAADLAVQEAEEHVRGLGTMEPVESIGIPTFR